MSGRQWTASQFNIALLLFFVVQKFPILLIGEIGG